MVGHVPYTVPFNDLSIPDPAVRVRYLEAIERVMVHGRVLLGPEVEELEGAIAAHCERRYAVGVGSGTDALMVALMALEIGYGDEVILGALSWIASANAVKMVGAEPVFVDVGSDLTIDPSAIEAAISPRTKAILAVDYTGRICHMEAIAKIAQRHDLHLVEDAAQAFGATRDGRPAGSFGVVSCFSMNPMKVFGALGEAGAVVTDREDLHRALLELRYNGMRDRVVSYRSGFNARIDTLHAAVMLCRLKEFPDALARRREIAETYARELRGDIDKPVPCANSAETFFCYCIGNDRRDALLDELTRRGIECKTRQWDYLPGHPALAEARVVSAEQARRQASRMLCLPIFEAMTDEQVTIVCEAVNESLTGLTA